MTRAIAAALAGALALAACGGGDDSNAEDTSTTTKGAYGVQVASYDLAADEPQRFLAGLLGNEGGLIVGGDVTFDFRYLGGAEGEPAVDDGPRIADVRGAFTTVADGAEATDGPRFREGDEGVGVYEATSVDFGRAGIWEVTVSGEISGEEFAIPASFEVHPTAAVPTVGDPAPRTINLLPGATDAPPKAVDSRAEDDGSVPDPELHSLTVADAIATARPTVVVISTPVFCVSRFCGPITDAVSTIAGEFEGRANFVHIEVWRDFEGKALNKGAAEWIYRVPEADAAEPWVFLIDGSGSITNRWDNVANGRAIREALSALLA